LNVMRIRALTCGVLQHSKIWTQNPSKATSWGSTPPPGTILSRLVSMSYGDTWVRFWHTIMPVRYKYGTVRISFIFIHLAD
jgi:hypothetical protein